MVGFVTHVVEMEIGFAKEGSPEMEGNKWCVGHEEREYRIWRGGGRECNPFKF